MKRLSILLLVFAGINGCGAGASEPSADYIASVESWREGRLERLTAPLGFLNLVGLHWLEPGTTTFGGGDANDFPFPGAGDAAMGSFELGPDGVMMRVNDGVAVSVDGEAASDVLMIDDTQEDAVTAAYGTLVWIVIKRQDMYGIRLYDTQNPVAADLPTIPQFDIDTKWRVTATLSLYDEPRIADVGTVVEGLGYNPVTPGVLEFEFDGEPYTLEAYEAANDQLFIVFGDRTSGRETYPAGRFLYADAPGEDGVTELDFNLSYNPPCAFNDFSTCPVASPRNRLPVAVNAGEKYIDALHVGKSDY